MQQNTRMPTFKLRKHQSNSSDEDILICNADFPELKLRDIVEIRSPKGSDPNKRLFLQIRKWSESMSTNANTVSIKESVTNHLKLYSDVVVEKVDRDDVLVDSIEICFSNAYLARSYMWGLRNFLNHRCVYQNQKLAYLNIRSQICEIWSQGNKVHSGFIDDDTKIVFRSASSLVYLFIQMSSEMWDYDINGDLYCEKAINGFLTDLFETWRKNDCSHDITIILFSRTFYEAESLEEFPAEMQDCLQVDSKGRFYEDYYIVAFQNDRFDLHDWNANLTKLKFLFNQYQKEVIDRHQNKYEVTIPRAYNSSASQGNFLEVLNMSLNVFEKHYFDRSFDRTGQLSVVVSPGVGVFEVDFEMTNLTKQRIIDNGIGSDLVCLGEQPLHTVPLLKLNSKSDSQNRNNFATCDVYNMPHWINLSFYSSTNQTYYSNFIPRIKLPTLQQTKYSIDSSYSTASSTNSTAQSKMTNTYGEDDTTSIDIEDKHLLVEDNSLEKRKKERYSTTSRNPNPSTVTSAPPIPDLVDYDEYDSQVFKPSSVINFQNQTPSSRRQNKFNNVLSTINNNETVNNHNGRQRYVSINQDELYKSSEDGALSSSSQMQRDQSKASGSGPTKITTRRKQVSENLPIMQLSSSTNRSRNNFPFAQMSLINNPLPDYPTKPESADDLLVRGYNMSSSRLNHSHSRPRALINPFDPSHMTIKLTPNRRRWTHVFPQGPTGTFMQQHHYQSMQQTKPTLSSAAPYLANVAFSPITELDECSVTRGGKCRPGSLSTVNQPNSSVSISNLRSSTTGGNHRLAVSSNQKIQQTVSVYQAPLHNNKSTVVSNDTIRFAWCASGEQEWTPAITTGVDWKSLTMPACLPLTTDFFPSKTSLQNDYVICEYTIDSSCIHPHYSLIEVYRELVCQRLQKGFQIILLPRQTRSTEQTPILSTSSPSNSVRRSATPTTTVSTASKQASLAGTIPATPSGHSLSSSSASSLANISAGYRASNRVKSSRNEQQQSLMAALVASASHNSNSSFNSQQTDTVFIEKERTDYTLSIGRIFHRLTLNSSTISVTQYRPRHPYPTIKIVYWYRFRAPFHDTYEKSLVHFKSEKLEEYNWNYLDNYICARGESFKLRSSLKFWRFRVLVLPSQLSLRKTNNGDDNNMASNDGHSDEDLERHDTHYLDYSDEERNALLESFNKLLEIINKTRRTSTTRSTSVTPLKGFANPNHHAVVHKTTAGTVNTSVSSSANTTSITSDDANRLVAIINNSKNNGVSESSKEPLELRSINMDIDSTLRDAKRAEWVHVQHHSHYDVNQAFELVIKWMVASGVGIAEMVQGWSRRAGNSSVHLVPIPWEPFAMPCSGKADPLRCPLFIQLQIDKVGTEVKLNDTQLSRLQELILRRFGFVRFYDLISTETIGPQYVHLTGFAFVGLKSISSASNNGGSSESAASTGYSGGLNDSLSSSKSASGFSGVGGEASAAHASHSHTTEDDLAAVARRGSSPTKFSPRARPPLSKSPSFDASYPLVPTNTTPTTSSSPSSCSQQTVIGIKAARHPPHHNVRLEHQDTVSSPHEEYITRHISGDRNTQGRAALNESHLSQRAEFIWSWNYMLTKRWRSTSTLDESAAVSLMQDFKRFCQNHQNRLACFYAQVERML